MEQADETFYYQNLRDAASNRRAELGESYLFPAAVGMITMELIGNHSPSPEEQQAIHAGIVNFASSRIVEQVAVQQEPVGELVKV